MLFRSLEFAAMHHYKNEVFVKGIPDVFIEHGAVNTLNETLELDIDSLHKSIKANL